MIVSSSLRVLRIIVEDGNRAGGRTLVEAGIEGDLDFGLLAGGKGGFAWLGGGASAGSINRANNQRTGAGIADFEGVDYWNAVGDGAEIIVGIDELDFRLAVLVDEPEPLRS